MKDSSKNFAVLAYPNGTYTLVDPENAQAMHSTIGPSAEASVVYAGPARIEASLRSAESAHVLYDVGMGTAANVLAVLERIAANPAARGTLTIYSFESKPDGLRTALENLDRFPKLRGRAGELRELLATGEARFAVGEVRVEWRLVVGDFYARLAEVPPPDTLFFDFYSPKVVPDLWSFENLTKLREKIGDRPATLYTYAAATPVRLHFLAAGFYVGVGTRTEIKNETTVAATRLADLENPLPRTWLRKLEASTSIAGDAFAAARTAAAENPQWSGS